MQQAGLVEKLHTKSSKKIVLLVMDGLGGLPLNKGGLTELETAFTPNLDKLAVESICGLMTPIAAGITPGSGPAHLSLFGYDPVENFVGRGVLSALGVGFDLQAADVAARLNFATKDENNLLTDRRAGRLATEKNLELAALLEKNVKIPGIEVFVRTEKEHRAAVIFRGKDLYDGLEDTDPQITGVPSLSVVATDPKAKHTADIINEFVNQANKILACHKPANTVLLRGIARCHKFPTMMEKYGLKAAAIAGYPMYKGVAKLVGMDIIDTENGVGAQLQTLGRVYADYDFFFVHIKKTDSTGEDGNFTKKVEAIEEVDKFLPFLLALKPDVLAITGDHSTPAALKGHSWHPVPVLLNSEYCLPDNVAAFGERAVNYGGLGHIPSTSLMPLLLANAMRLMKFGA